MFRKLTTSLFVSLILLTSFQAVQCKDEQQQYDTSFARKLAVLAGIYLTYKGFTNTVETIGAAMIFSGIEKTFFPWPANYYGDTSFVTTRLVNIVLLAKGMGSILLTSGGVWLCKWGITNPDYEPNRTENASIPAAQ